MLAKKGLCSLLIYAVKERTHLTHRWELNNEITWTREGKHHTPWPITGRWEGGGIALEVIPDGNDKLMGADELMGTAHQHDTSIHMLQTCMLCTCTLQLKV